MSPSSSPRSSPGNSMPKSPSPSLVTADVIATSAEDILRAMIRVTAPSRAMTNSATITTFLALSQSWACRSSM